MVSGSEDSDDRRYIINSTRLFMLRDGQCASSYIIIRNKLESALDRRLEDSEKADVKAVIQEQTLVESTQTLLRDGFGYRHIRLEVGRTISR
jgi:hypothetical protein